MLDLFFYFTFYLFGGVYAPNPPPYLRDWSHRHASIGRSSQCSATDSILVCRPRHHGGRLCRPHTTDCLLVDYQFQRRSLYCWIGWATAAATTVLERAGSRQSELGDSAGDNSSVVRAIHFTGVFVWRATWKARQLVDSGTRSVPINANDTRCTRNNRLRLYSVLSCTTEEYDQWYDCPLTCAILIYAESSSSIRLREKFTFLSSNDGEFKRLSVDKKFSNRLQITPRFGFLN